ncbi:MAG: DUF3108 domain-containing protein [Bacteroidales bacterium]|nr:DUF3108 domain-containing protein [Bacteroidales bacterium]
MIPGPYCLIKPIRNIKEGNYKYYDEVFYDHPKKEVYSKKSDSIYKVPEGILDMVSTLYYLRSLNFEKMSPGDAFEVITFLEVKFFHSSSGIKALNRLKQNSVR